MPTTQRLCTWWNGEPLASAEIAMLVFPCRRVAGTVDSQHAAPRGGADAPGYVLGVAATADEAIVVAPDQLGAFLLAHRQAVIICHDAAGLHWTLHDFFVRTGKEDATRALWAFSAESRLVDLGLLHGQIRSWQHKDVLDEVTLERLAKEVARQNVPASDSLRQAAQKCIDEPRNTQAATTICEAAEALWTIYHRSTRSRSTSAGR